MRSPLRLAAVLGLGLLAAPPAAAQDTAWPLYRNEKFGFELKYPPGFVVGAYAESYPPDLEKRLRETGQPLPFEHAIVLVEKARLGGRDPRQLPTGELATITVHPKTGAAVEAAQRLSTMVYKNPEATLALGGRTVLRYPGMPGPYGTEAYYYVVAVAREFAIEVYAHRRDPRLPNSPTGYDRLIEQILATLRLFPPKP